MIGLRTLWILLHLGLALSKEPGFYSEVPEDLRLQTSQNVVPRIGRRAIYNSGLKKVAKKGNPVSYFNDQDGRDEDSYGLPVLATVGEGVIPPATLIPWKVGSSPSKRMVPGYTSWRLGKRLRYADALEGKLKRSATPGEEGQFVWHNILRSPQGFRFHDNLGDYTYTSRYRRNGQFSSLQMDPSPLVGKRLEENSVEILIPSNQPLTRVPRPTAWTNVFQSR